MRFVLADDVETTAREIACGETIVMPRETTPGARHCIWIDVVGGIEHAQETIVCSSTRRLGTLARQWIARERSERAHAQFGLKRMTEQHKQRKEQAQMVVEATPRCCMETRLGWFLTRVEIDGTEAFGVLTGCGLDGRQLPRFCVDDRRVSFGGQHALDRGRVDEAVLDRDVRWDGASPTYQGIQRQEAIALSDKDMESIVAFQRVACWRFKHEPMDEADALSVLIVPMTEGRIDYGAMQRTERGEVGVTRHNGMVYRVFGRSARRPTDRLEERRKKLIDAQIETYIDLARFQGYDVHEADEMVEAAVAGGEGRVDLVARTMDMYSVTDKQLEAFGMVPRVLHRLLYMYSIAEFAEQHLDAYGLGMEVVVPLFVSQSAQEPWSYERIEYLGDSVLKYVVSTMLFHRGTLDSGTMSVLRAQMVSNQALARSVAGMDIPGILHSQPFVQGDWGYDQGRMYKRRHERRIGSKMVADVVEALIGGLYVHRGLEAVVHFLKRQGIISALDVEGMQWRERGQCRLEAMNVARTRLGYDFVDDRLLQQAFMDRGGGMSYDRLEFLGDAVLELVSTVHVMSRQPVDGPGEMSGRREVFVANETMADMVVGLGMHELVDTSKPRQLITAYVNATGRTKAPKFLADVGEAIVGAVYVDSKSLGRTWRVIERHVSDIVEQRGQVTKHPVRALQEAAGRQDATVEYAYSDHVMKGKRQEVCQVWVDGREIARAVGSSKRGAKREASEQALERLGWNGKKQRRE